MITSTIREIPGHGPVEVRRSRRRKRTVSVSQNRGRLVLSIPATLTRAEENKWVEKAIEWKKAKAARTQISDDDLLTRANSLARTYLPEGVRPASVRWVRNQRSLWGSCTTVDGAIRISHRLKEMPSWVLDYVLVHELAHLVHDNHGAGFQAIVDQYPKTQRAKGFLEGVAFAEATGAAQ